MISDSTTPSSAFRVPRSKVLVVDDEESIRITVSEFIKEDGHEVNTAADATQALRLIEEQDFDVIVTDIILPKIRGVQLLKNIHEVSQEIQVVMITGEPNVDTAAEAVRAGAFDYLAKPISRQAIKEVVLKAAKTKALLDEKKRLEQDNLMYQEHLEELVKERTTALQESEERFRTMMEQSPLAIQIMTPNGRIVQVNDAYEKLWEITLKDLSEYNILKDEQAKSLGVMPYIEAAFAGETLSLPPFEYGPQKTEDRGRTRWIQSYIYPVKDESGEIRNVIMTHEDISKRKRAEEAVQESLNGTIQAIGQTTEMRDPYTAGHQRRVTQLVCVIAKEMELPNEQIEGIRVAGLVHDIGKISIPAEILSKPSKLTDTQFDLIKGHSQAGYEILKNIEFPWPIEQIVLQHHERMDGSGYPQGIKGEQIMVEARLLGVADVVEAMASHRPYRPALGIDKALEEIEKRKGTLYDPKVVDACLKLFAEDRFEFEN